MFHRRKIRNFLSAPFFRQDQLWLAGPGSYSLVRLPMEPYLRGFRYPVIIKESTNLPLGR